MKLTSDSGYFWFFNPDNIEVVTKVLNACGVNGRYWTFAAGLTNVEVTLFVTDRNTGALRTYMNPLNSAFQPVLDTGRLRRVRESTRAVVSRRRADGAIDR